MEIRVGVRDCDNPSLLKKAPRLASILRFPFSQPSILKKKYLFMETRESNFRRLFCGVDRPVHVISYTRVRYGKTEQVCEHCRSKWGSNNAT